jgi:hypothetical protein
MRFAFQICILILVLSLGVSYEVVLTGYSVISYQLYIKGQIEKLTDYTGQIIFDIIESLESQGEITLTAIRTGFEPIEHKVLTNCNQILVEQASVGNIWVLMVYGKKKEVLTDHGQVEKHNVDDTFIAFKDKDVLFVDRKTVGEAIIGQAGQYWSYKVQQADHKYILSLARIINLGKEGFPNQSLSTGLNIDNKDMNQISLIFKYNGVLLKVGTEQGIEVNGLICEVGKSPSMTISVDGKPSINIVGSREQVENVCYGGLVSHYLVNARMMIIETKKRRLRLF